jgi:hypothetical protein
MNIAEGMYQPLTTNRVSPLQGTSAGRASAVFCTVDIGRPRGKLNVRLVLLTLPVAGLNATAVSIV